MYAVLFSGKRDAKVLLHQRAPEHRLTARGSPMPSTQFDALLLSGQVFRVPPGYIFDTVTLVVCMVLSYTLVSSFVEIVQVLRSGAVHRDFERMRENKRRVEAEKQYLRTIDKPKR